MNSRIFVQITLLKFLFFNTRMLKVLESEQFEQNQTMGAKEYNQDIIDSFSGTGHFVEAMC